MQQQNFIPKIRERFWGKFKPICQFIILNELNKTVLKKSKISAKIAVVTQKKEKVISIRISLISHIRVLKNIKII